MKQPEITRIAVFAAGVVIATVSCLTVGALLEQSLQTDPSAAPVEASRTIDDSDVATLRPDLLQIAEP